MSKEHWSQKNNCNKSITSKKFFQEPLAFENRWVCPTDWSHFYGRFIGKCGLETLQSRARRAHFRRYLNYISSHLKRSKKTVNRTLKPQCVNYVGIIDKVLEKNSILTQKKSLIRTDRILCPFYSHGIKNAIHFLPPKFIRPEWPNAQMPAIKHSLKPTKRD